MYNSKKIKPKNNIIFGIFLSLLFLIVGLYPSKIVSAIKFSFLFLFLVFFIITIVKPDMFTILNKLFIKIGFLLGTTISPIIMAFIFFLVITPIGIIFRLFNKQNMTSTTSRTSSYWINTQCKVLNMKKQF